MPRKTHGCLTTTAHGTSSSARVCATNPPRLDWQAAWRAPPWATCITSAPRPPDGTFRYQFLEAVEPSPVWQSLDFSADLDDLVTLYDAITQNPSLADAAGAGTATILWTWLNALGTTLQVPNDGSKATGNKLLSGYMVFEYTDEWDKWTDATSDTATVELAAGVQDFSDKSITGWASPSLTTTPPASQPISLNTTWDEEWFGL